MSWKYTAKICSTQTHKTFEKKLHLEPLILVCCFITYISPVAAHPKQVINDSEKTTKKPLMIVPIYCCCHNPAGGQTSAPAAESHKPPSVFYTDEE